jgi:ATP-dependent helicase Lhr and Lhr-like helicase
VVDGKKTVGTLDSSFARARTLPFVFVLGGQEWNALKIDHEMQQVVG